MYAIVDIAGKQFKVEKDRFVYAPNVAGDEGASVEFDRVLLVEDDNGVEIGTPVISGARVAGKILEHGRGDKVIVFKKKRRKGYKKTQGHRQGYSKILIEDILLKGQKASQKASPKKEETPKKEEDSKQEAPKTETKAKPAKQKAPVKAPQKAPAAQDDLKKINGLGPKFEEALNEQGIYTFQQLADLSADEMATLDEAIDGITVETLKDVWIPQAKKLLAQHDLQQINGIGPKFEEALHKHGYYTLEQISQLTEEQMEELAEIDGITVGLIKDEDWVGQAKKLLAQYDLQQINGIGPKFEEALHKHGYYTLEQISQLTEEQMEELAEIDGVTVDLIKHEDWVGQAKKLLAQYDLQQINGIGPKFEEALHKHGYYTLEQISQLTEEQMEELAEIDGITVGLIKDEDWVGQAKKLLKK